jgi:hypothetical protein
MAFMRNLLFAAQKIGARLPIEEPSEVWLRISLRDYYGVRPENLTAVARFSSSFPERGG